MQWYIFRNMVQQRVGRAGAGSRAERLRQHRGKIYVAKRFDEVIDQQCYDIVSKESIIENSRFLVVSVHLWCLLKELFVCSGSHR